MVDTNQERQMLNGLYTVDFHAHLQGSEGLSHFCARDQQSFFYRSIMPTLEKLAHITEPIHDEIVGHFSHYYRDRISRFLYSRIGTVGLMEILRKFKLYDLRLLLKTMDVLDIDHVVIHSIEPLTTTADIIAQTAPWRDRISVFASFCAAQDDPVGYLKPLIATGNVAGLKLHPIVGGFSCGELLFRCKDVFELVDEAKLPVLIHTGHIPTEALNEISGCTDALAMEPLIKAFPGVQFVLGHIGWESWRKVLGMAQRYDNITVETSWQPAKVIRRAVDAIGAHRVLFGSDYPLNKPSRAIAQVKQALSPKELVQVMSTNAVRLLKLKPKYSSSSLSYAQGKPSPTD